MAAGNIAITQGTQTALPIDTVGTVDYPISKIDVGNLGSTVPWQGSVVVTTGTITISGGIGTTNVGTINTGTINVGTVDSVSQMPPNQWGTVINSGTSTVGTLKAGIGGSVIYITDLIISVGTASNVVLGNGTPTVPLAGTMFFNGNGGLVSNFRVPLVASSGSAIVYQQSANTSLSITAQGYVK